MGRVRRSKRGSTRVSTAAAESSEAPRGGQRTQRARQEEAPSNNGEFESDPELFLYSDSEVSGWAISPGESQTSTPSDNNAAIGDNEGDIRGNPPTSLSRNKDKGGSEGERGGNKRRRHRGARKSKAQRYRKHIKRTRKNRRRVREASRIHSSDTNSSESEISDSSSSSESQSSSEDDYVQVRNPLCPRKRQKLAKGMLPPPMLESHLSIHVPEKMKRAIRRGEYVELSKLLPNYAGGFEQGGVMVMAKDGSLVCEKSADSQKITNISTWLSAFFVFMDVSMEAFPEMGRELLHYCSIIKRLALVPGYAWLRYDTAFRMAMPHHTSLQWTKKDPEIYDRCMLPERSFGQSFQSFRGGDSRPSPTSSNICWAFNKPTGCKHSKCRFRHACKKCGKDGHSVLVCRSEAAPVPSGPGASGQRQAPRQEGSSRQ